MCPLCGAGRARRSCPALGQQICARCCGTKRLVEIRCPQECPYLASAREHPAAATLRQRERDFALVTHHARDLSQRQMELFLLVNTFLLRYEPPALQPLIDADIADAAEAIARTYETSARGVIYDHRAEGLPADRLATRLKPLIAEVGRRWGSSFDRDAAVVLRRIAEAARTTGAAEGERAAYLALLGRVLKEQGAQAGGAGDDTPRLIV